MKPIWLWALPGFEKNIMPSYFNSVKGRPIVAASPLSLVR